MFNLYQWIRSFDAMNSCKWQWIRLRAKTNHSFEVSRQICSGFVSQGLSDILTTQRSNLNYSSNNYCNVSETKPNFFSVKTLDFCNLDLFLTISFRMFSLTLIYREYSLRCRIAGIATVSMLKRIIRLLKVYVGRSYEIHWTFFWIFAIFSITGQHVPENSPRKHPKNYLKN